MTNDVLDDDALMDEDVEEFLSAGKEKPAPEPEVNDTPPAEPEEAPDQRRAARTEKRAARYGRKTEEPAPSEDADIWQQRLKVLWDDYLLRIGRPSDRKTRHYKCEDPRCGLIIEALTTEARMELPDGHPERIVRCPNVGTDKHVNPGISPMSFVD